MVSTCGFRSELLYQPMFYSAQVCLARNNLTEALKYLDSALEALPDRLPEEYLAQFGEDCAYLCRGILNYDLKRPLEALADLEISLNLAGCGEPRRADIFLVMGRCCSALGRFRESAQAYARAWESAQQEPASLTLADREELLAEHILAGKKAAGQASGEPPDRDRPSLKH
jgi:tetratricopeptide (TPR) repeat protein